MQPPDPKPPPKVLCTKNRLFKAIYHFYRTQTKYPADDRYSILVLGRLMTQNPAAKLSPPRGGFSLGGRARDKVGWSRVMVGRLLA
eukprot:scaffold74939_cov30-Phaeocystis_antarctica.AAC.1